MAISGNVTVTLNGIPIPGIRDVTFSEPMPMRVYGQRTGPIGAYRGSATIEIDRGEFDRLLDRVCVGPIPDPIPLYVVGQTGYRTMYGASMAAQRSGASKKRVRHLWQGWHNNRKGC